MTMMKTTFDHNPHRTGMARLVDGISYSAIGGENTTLTLLRPWEEETRYPLVVFVQGSGWTTPCLGFEIPQLSHLAQQGYIIATVSHRSSTDGNPFPAFLQDVKTAIRFLRAHAEDYSIDPERVGIYGTSSGGNTALLIAATGDDPRYETPEYAGVSDAVNCVVSCFGPTDLTIMADHTGPSNPIFAALIGGNDPQTVLREISPYCHIREDTPFPPCLLAHGTADPIVPYAQATHMADRLNACGNEVHLLTVTDAPHEDTFWSQPLIDAIYAFIKAHI